MKKLNILFIIYIIIGLFYVAFAANGHGLRVVVLVSAGWITCCGAAAGYALNGGK